jgi:multidrug transporter EmrE-like cation transporter
MNTVIKNIQTWMGNSVVDELLIIVILIAIVESLAQNTLKQSSHQISLNYILVLLAYIMVGVLLHYAYHKFSLSKVNVIWSSISIVIATTLGYFLYDEPMNIKNLFAVCFALLAVIFSYFS